MSSTSRTPTLAEIFALAAKKQSIETRVAVPARVESYDAAKQWADVQPLLKESYRDATDAERVESLPVVQRVPVIFPGGGGYRFVFPLTRGDIVLLVFSDRSLDRWKAQGGEVDPVDLRRHTLSDAVAIPCIADPAGAPAAKAIEVQANGDVVLNGGTAKVAREGDPVAFETPAGLWDAFFTLVAALVPLGAGTAAYNAAKAAPIGTIDDGATNVKA